MDLDVKDCKILMELDTNARKPDSAIAKSVGLSKQVTNYRITRLEKRGIIKGYIPVIDHTKLGLRLYKVLLKIENLDAEKEKELIAYLKRHSSWLVSMLGNWDFTFGFYAEDEYAFMRFWRRFYDKYGYAVEDRFISLITTFWNFERSCIFPQNKDRDKAFILGLDPEKVDIDEIDDAILKELTKNARQTSLEIANRIDQTERVVRYRMKKLEKSKVLLGYRAFIDTNAIGFKFYKVFVNLKDAKKQDIKTIRNYIMQNPNVGYSTEALVGPDFEMEVYFNDSEDLFSFISSLKNEFPNFIKSVETLYYMKEYKVTYYPIAT
jgi:DNA-binding Lrp family transcriptional regulator